MLVYKNNNNNQKTVMLVKIPGYPYKDYFL